MTNELILLVDNDSRLLAAVRTERIDAGAFHGKLLFHNFPEPLVAALRTYEEIVNTQQFAFVDEAADAILTFDISAWLPQEGRHCSIQDLQIMNGKVYFRFAAADVS